MTHQVHHSHDLAEKDQQKLIENQVLVPKILGNAVSLPPLIVLIGVTIAGAKAGIVGVFLTTPIMATGKVALNYVYGR